MTDEELILIYKGGDKNAFDKIYQRYINLINYYCRNMYLLGGDMDDLIQEGIIGLSKAVDSYDNNKGSFISYATKCIKSNVYTAIKKYSNNKNKPLNESDSLEELDKKLIFSGTPEDVLLETEKRNELKKNIFSRLSNSEILVLTLYLQGFSYQEIGEKIGKNAKFADNALQRIRKKTINFLGE